MILQEICSFVQFDWVELDRKQMKRDLYNDLRQSTPSQNSLFPNEYNWKRLRDFRAF